MDYEKKYKEALERMKSWANGDHPECFSEAQKTAEFIFPELAESKEERTRKEILNVFKQLDEGTTICGRKYDYAKWIAWLEKQGEEVTNINGEDYGIDGLYHAINILEKTLGRVEGYQSDDGILSHKAAINAVKELYKKQGEKKNTRKREIDDAYLQGICDAKHEIEKQGKKLDADKVIEWLRYHIQVDEPKIEYNKDGQPLAESFIAHANARCMAADEVIEQFKKNFGL